jgi:hypothetical protein
MTRSPNGADPLLRDLVHWISREPRHYKDVMDAWRTSCPRLTIWEDAIDFGLISRSFKAGTGDIVTVTEKGRAFLSEAGAYSTA